MNYPDLIVDAAEKFDNPAQAILARCEQSGLHIRMEGNNLKVKGNHETIAAWRAIIQRHKPEIIAALAGQTVTIEDDANDSKTLCADYAELIHCISELCQLAGYTDDLLNRMLTAAINLYPFKYADEASYFIMQVCRAKAGTYWQRIEPSQSSGNTHTSPGMR